MEAVLYRPFARRLDVECGHRSNHEAWGAPTRRNIFPRDSPSAMVHRVGRLRDPQDLDCATAAAVYVARGRLRDMSVHCFHIRDCECSALEADCGPVRLSNEEDSLRSDRLRRGKRLA
uniref:Uncharacterized protein n=1 Tax=Peronospora matthiolae TaxID=2874970 RepID=A0AAV1TEU9_9STRA